MRWTEISNAKLKLIQSLKLRKYREKYRWFTVEGDNVIIELLKRDPSPIKAIVGTESFLNDNQSIIVSTVSEVYKISPLQLKKISRFQSVGKALAVCQMIPMSWVNQNVYFYLNAIQDPGNVGTLIRTAHWFGYRMLIADDDTADFYNAKTLRASMGSFSHTAIMRMPFDELIERCPNYRIFELTGRGVPLTERQMTTPAIIILGNEGHGATISTSDYDVQRISIPTRASQPPDSLNVSVAGAICMATLAQGTRAS